MKRNGVVAVEFALLMPVIVALLGLGLLIGLGSARKIRCEYAVAVTGIAMQQGDPDAVPKGQAIMQGYGTLVVGENITATSSVSVLGRLVPIQAVSQQP